jgi:hypothetical protein
MGRLPVLTPTIMFSYSLSKKVAIVTGGATGTEMCE